MKSGGPRELSPPNWTFKVHWTKLDLDPHGTQSSILSPSEHFEVRMGLSRPASSPLCDQLDSAVESKLVQLDPRRPASDPRGPDVYLSPPVRAPICQIIPPRWKLYVGHFSSPVCSPPISVFRIITRFRGCRNIKNKLIVTQHYCPVTSFLYHPVFILFWRYTQRECSVVLLTV